MIIRDWWQAITACLPRIRKITVAFSLSPRAECWKKTFILTTKTGSPFSGIVYSYFILFRRRTYVLHLFAPLPFSLIACAHVHILVWEYMQSFQRQTTVRVHAAGNRQRRGGNEPNWHFELYDSATIKFRRILLLNVAPWRRHCYFMYLHSYLTCIVFYSPLFYHV